MRHNHHFIDQWKVVVSSMNPVGARGTGHSPLAQILRPGEVFGRSRIGLAVFDAEGEAQNFLQTLRTPFYRFLYGCLGDSQSLLGKLAPDLEDYTGNACWPFKGPLEELDQTLWDSYGGLTDEERSFVHEWVGKLAPLQK